MGSSVASGQLVTVTAGESTENRDIL